MEETKFLILASEFAPITQGTEKQIKWAQGIRIDVNAALIGRMGRFYKAYQQGKVIEEQLVVLRQAIVDELNSHDAKWWIDHRYDFETMMDLDTFWRSLILKAKEKMEEGNH